HVRPVLDHPLGYGQTFRGGSSSTTLRGPGQWAIVVVAEGCAVQFRVMRHHLLNEREVVGVDGLLEAANFVQRLDVSLKLRPTCEAIPARNAKLCVGQRISLSRLVTLMPS